LKDACSEERKRKRKGMGVDMAKEKRRKDWKSRDGKRVEVKGLGRVEIAKE
jgi:hypothetical protein